MKKNIISFIILLSFIINFNIYANNYYYMPIKNIKISNIIKDIQPEEPINQDLILGFHRFYPSFGTLYRPSLTSIDLVYNNFYIHPDEFGIFTIDNNNILTFQLNNSGNFGGDDLSIFDGYSITGLNNLISITILENTYPNEHITINYDANSININFKSYMNYQHYLKIQLNF